MTQTISWLIHIILWAFLTCWRIKSTTFKANYKTCDCNTCCLQHVCTSYPIHTRKRTTLVFRALVKQNAHHRRASVADEFWFFRKILLYQARWVDEQRTKEDGSWHNQKYHCYQELGSWKTKKKIFISVGSGMHFCCTPLSSIHDSSF